MPDHFTDHLADHHCDHWIIVERLKNDSVMILIAHFDQQPMQRGHLLDEAALHGLGMVSYKRLSFLAQAMACVRLCAPSLPQRL